MPVKTIYEEYAPTAASKKAKLEEIFIQAVSIFATECVELSAESADEVEIALSRKINTPIFWETITKRLNAFENQTKLTIFESILMTIKRREKIIADRIEVPK